MASKVTMRRGFCPVPLGSVIALLEG
jgi:hypothetical protein